jgi:hypothetical protein
VRVVLVHGSQVSNHHGWDTHCFWPRGVYFHDGKILLLGSKDVRGELSELILRVTKLLISRVLWPEEIRKVSLEIKHDRVRLLSDASTGTEPIYLLVIFHHNHAMRVASCNL